jgi:ATP-dependent Lhr-like helicase
VLLRDGDPVIYVERGGKGILLLARLDDEQLGDALAALAQAAEDGVIPKLGVEKVDGAPVFGSGFEEALGEAGFSRQPKRMVAAG